MIRFRVACSLTPLRSVSSCVRRRQCGSLSIWGRGEGGYELWIWISIVSIRGSVVSYYILHLERDLVGTSVGAYMHQY
ncbi:hypothetical protein BDV26DRAFT_271437 [Aspergillus bertholletiae]|uniref:Uncharacterized protein n=1 Tax=Aspergillus bertholletiae TaxID=1226010 RepID=A0A5N7AV18_9EURO|nr:hypothetical protein BDV26DRAFT_271437 [Aspergillus bertholletiae]